MWKTRLREKLIQTVRNSPSLDERLTRFSKELHPSTTVILDYAINSRPRHGHGRPPLQRLHEIIDRKRDAYRETLESILLLKEALARIPLRQPDAISAEPYWLNGWLPALDAAALYGMLRLHNPRRYFEVGSGNSTKFARRAVSDGALRTTLLSADPQPRAEIDALCDRCLRQPLEELDLALFDELEEGDILFVDCSHRILMNSDDTVFFLELLPRLKPGVLVQVHDIFLPADYPADWADRFYSEQYVLAAYLLAEWWKLETVLPNYFITTDPELSAVLAPLWNDLASQDGTNFPSGFNRGGGSYWLRIK